MHHRAIFALPLLLSAVVLARPQTPADTSALSGLPACAQDAATAALASSGCPVNNQTCICSSAPFISAITTAVTQTCSPTDVQAALVFGQNFCGAALNGGGGGSSSSSSAAPAGDAASSSPSASGDDSYNGVSTTTVPGTLTSVTSVAGATDSMMTTTTTSGAAATDLSSGGGAVMTSTAQCTSTTTTMMTTAASKPTGAYNATYTGGVGAVMKNAAGPGMMAAVVGVAGAVALL